MFEAIPVNDRQLESVIAAAQRVPDLAIVLNHLGRPPVPENSWEPWGTQMTQAAACSNISVKLSAGGDLVARWTLVDGPDPPLRGSCPRFVWT